MRTRTVPAVLVLVAALAASACTAQGSSAPKKKDCITYENSRKCLPLQPESKRVDKVRPVFSSRSTVVDHPLFPVGTTTQLLQLGTVDGKPFRAEVTPLPAHKIIEWNGQRVETIVSQYTAYSGGRIVEVAHDWYAQADDGSVWYFGEDVFNYENGVVADNEGTWIAGQKGAPAAMIMPAKPKLGDAYRTENNAPVVFEEVVVTEVGKTVDGPRGPVAAAIVARELHQDGATENKTFAPGYGEFFTGDGQDAEYAALAIPTDSLPGPVPAELTALSAGAARAYDEAGAGDWNGAAAALASARAAWNGFRAKGAVPKYLGEQMSAALDGLTTAVGARADAQAAALLVAHAALDFQLRHRPVGHVDLERTALWARQLGVDAAARDQGGVDGDVATLERMWDRTGHVVSTADAERIRAQLRALRTAADDDDLRSAASGAAALLTDLTALRPA
jgi:hypothetical protein